jgi:hypothetical protein
MTRYVAVVGNPDMGYSIHGPFSGEAKAHDWIDEQNIVEHSTCVMELVDAREGYYREDEDDETESEL